MSLFGVTMETLRQAATFSLRRHEMLAENVANAETANFRSRDLTFMHELTLAQQVTSVTPQNMNTPELDLRVLTSPDGPPRGDGNDVDIDKQMARVAQNTLYHETVLQLMRSSFASLKTAINGHA